MVFVCVQICNHASDEARVVDLETLAPLFTVKLRLRSFEAISDNLDLRRIDIQPLDQVASAGMRVRNKARRTFDGPTLPPRSHRKYTLIPLVPNAKLRARPFPDQPANNVRCQRIREQNVGPHLTQKPCDFQCARQSSQRTSFNRIRDDPGSDPISFTTLSHRTRLVKAPHFYVSLFMLSQTPRKY